MMKRSIPSLRGQDRGFSLIEVLFAMGILASILVAIISLFVLAQRSIYSGKQLTRATTIAQNITEEMLRMLPRETWLVVGADDTDNSGSWLSHDSAGARTTNPNSNPNSCTFTTSTCTPSSEG